MKNGKHQKPRPKFDWKTVDWEAVLLLIICVVVSIALVIGLIRGFVAFPRDCSSDSSDSNTYSERDETEWIAPEVVIEEIESSAPEPKTVTRRTYREPDSSSEEHTTTEDASSEEETSNRIHIGRCRLTVYTPTEGKWGYTTATGVKSQHIATCAVDPKVIPYGSTVVITTTNGDELKMKAVDCGNFSGKWIDIFFEGTERSGIYWLNGTFGGEFADVWIER